MEAIYGVTMDQLAQSFSKEGELRAQLGEQQGRAEFERYLAAQGITLNTWALAWNAWHDRFKADPTGMLEAQFHMQLQQLSAKAHFGDVRDMSGDTEEGITLDQYAQITVAVSRAGADADAIVKQFGLADVAHWQRANAAWTQKMSQDTTHKLTMQYGQLYSKYAGPSFQQEQLAQTAAILADHNRPRDRVDEPQEPLTPELCLQKMQSPSQAERWKYAYLYGNMAELGNVPDRNQAIMAVTPILMEMIERHDEHTTSDAEKGARKLWDLGVRGDDFRGAVHRCLNRAEEKLASLQAAFAPIQNQAVPERITLQSRIQDYQSLISTMRDYMSQDWSTAMAPSAMPMGSMMPGGAPMPHPAHMPMARSGGGFPRWILAPVILVLAAGGFFVTKGRQLLAARSAAAASASAAPSASAPAAKVAATPVVSAPPTASAPTAAATAPAAATTTAKPAVRPKGGKKRR